MMMNLQKHVVVKCSFVVHLVGDAALFAFVRGCKVSRRSWGSFSSKWQVLSVVHVNRDPIMSSINASTSLQQILQRWDMMCDVHRSYRGGIRCV